MSLFLHVSVVAIGGEGLLQFFLAARIRNGFCISVCMSLMVCSGSIIKLVQYFRSDCAVLYCCLLLSNLISSLLNLVFVNLKVFEYNCCSCVLWWALLLSCCLVCSISSLRFRLSYWVRNFCCNIFSIVDDISYSCRSSWWWVSTFETCRVVCTYIINWIQLHLVKKLFDGIDNEITHLKKLYN